MYNKLNGKQIKTINPIKGGGLMVSYDYSTLEVRIFAALCKDEKLREILSSGADLHSSMARQVFPDILKDKTTEEIKEHYSEYRSYSKTVLFGLLYGKSVHTLARDLNITDDAAQGIQDSLFNAFPGIPKYIEKQHKFAQENGYIVDVFGSVRPVPDAQLPDWGATAARFGHAMNVAQNSPIQSSASRAAWMAAAHIQEEFILQNMKSVMIGGVHDSTYVDCYPGELLDVIKVFDHHAIEIPNTTFEWLNGNKLIADIGIGISWGYELDVKSYKDNGDTFTIKLKGGNVNWELLKKELDYCYNYKVLSYEEGDELKLEGLDATCPLDLATKTVKVEVEFENNSRIKEFKSQYFKKEN